MALYSFKPLDLGSATEHAGSLLGITWAVLLPGDRGAKIRLEWDVLLIQWLALPEMALMGAVISPLLPWLAVVASSSSSSRS